MGVARVWLVCRLFAYTKILNIRESAVAAYRIKSSQQNHAVEYTCIESDPDRLVTGVCRMELLTALRPRVTQRKRVEVISEVVQQ